MYVDNEWWLYNNFLLWGLFGKVIGSSCIRVDKVVGTYHQRKIVIKYLYICFEKHNWGYLYLNCF